MAANAHFVIGMDHTAAVSTISEMHSEFGISTPIFLLFVVDSQPAMARTQLTMIHRMDATHTLLAELEWGEDYLLTSALHGCELRLVVERYLPNIIHADAEQ